jgi:hypothetical protein
MQLHFSQKLSKPLALLPTQSKDSMRPVQQDKGASSLPVQVRGALRANERKLVCASVFLELVAGWWLSGF